MADGVHEKSYPRRARKEAVRFRRGTPSCPPLGKRGMGRLVAVRFNLVPFLGML